MMISRSWKKMLESCSVVIVVQFSNMKMFWRLVYIQVYLTLLKGVRKMGMVVNSILHILPQLKIKNISQI